MIVATKYCPDCGFDKPSCDFHIQRSSKDGLQCYCKDHMKARNRVSAKRYRDKNLERSRKWNRDNPEARRVHKANARARKIGLEDSLTITEWLEILFLYNYKCAYCGGAFSELDHVVPLDRGGGSTKTNVVPACSPCNRKKMAWQIPHDAYIHGYIDGYQKACKDLGFEGESEAGTGSRAQSAQGRFRNVKALHRS